MVTENKKLPSIGAEPENDEAGVFDDSSYASRNMDSFIKKRENGRLRMVAKGEMAGGANSIGQEADYSGGKWGRVIFRSNFGLRLVIAIVLLMWATWIFVTFIGFGYEKKVADSMMNNQLSVVITEREAPPRAPAPGTPVNVGGQASTITPATNESENTQVGQVTTPTGGQVSVPVDSPRLTQPAPTQSRPISEAELPEESIKITATDEGFSPNTFSVLPGQEITLSLTVHSQEPVLLTFVNDNMAAVGIGCSPGDTRFVKFTAPTLAGEYVFINNIPDRRHQTGKMIVAPQEF